MLRPAQVTQAALPTALTCSCACARAHVYSLLLLQAVSQLLAVPMLMQDMLLLPQAVLPTALKAAPATACGSSAARHDHADLGHPAGMGLMSQA